MLIVDPDSEARSLYRESLQSVGCDIVEASDGRDALVKALVHPPTVVVSEIRLPVFDGAALCDILRRDSTTRTVAIVIVTGEARPAELARVRAAGADVVFVKPAAIDHVVREIERLLEPEARDRIVAAVSSPGTPEHKRKPFVKAHIRCETTTPPEPPPELHCPLCDGLLQYEHSHIGGVSQRHSEQWDQFSCSCGGTFEYRHRTRKLRRVG